MKTVFLTWSDWWTAHFLSTCEARQAMEQAMVSEESWSYARIPFVMLVGYGHGHEIYGEIHGEIHVENDGTMIFFVSFGGFKWSGNLGRSLFNGLMRISNGDTRGNRTRCATNCTVYLCSKWWFTLPVYLQIIDLKKERHGFSTDGRVNRWSWCMAPTMIRMCLIHAPSSSLLNISSHMYNQTANPCPSGFPENLVFSWIVQLGQYLHITFGTVQF